MLTPNVVTLEVEDLPENSKALAALTQSDKLAGHHMPAAEHSDFYAGYLRDTTLNSDIS